MTHGEVTTMTTTKLILLSGTAGSGKDSTARLLIEHHGWVLHSLAGPMKRFAADMFGFTDEQLHGPSKFRNEPDPRWARPCPRCTGSGDLREGDSLTMEVKFTKGGCRACDGAGRIDDNSPRRILQLMGEEFLRQMIHPDVLTIRAVPEIQEMLRRGRKVVVNDARNDNDRDNLHLWLGGHRVDVRTDRVKLPTPTSTWRCHVSEHRQPSNDSVEHVIHQGDERWPFPSLPAKVEEMLRCLSLA